MTPRAPAARNRAPRETSFLEGGGELGALMRAFDWSTTPLGPPERWPQSLRSAVSILLPSKAQIVLFWGPEFITLYNDAYRPVFGAKHPGALGRPASEAWREIWESGLRELFEGVVTTGEAFWARDRLFILERHGYPEETYFDVSYDPVRDESGKVGGLFCIVSETSGRVIGERRLRTLRDLAARPAEARTPEEACLLSLESLAHNPHDIPFALLYLAQHGDVLPLLACGSPGAGELAHPGHWPWSIVLGTGEPQLVPLDPSIPVPAGAWPRPPERALVLPITGPGQSRSAGMLVVGLNPFQSLEGDYRSFLGLVAGQIGAAIANAQAYEEERARAEALAQLDRAKTAFFSNISHEFRTPLTLMLGPLEETLAGDSGLPPEDRERLEAAHRNAVRLLKLVNSLLDFSRLEAGRLEAYYQPTDLAELTAELAGVFRPAIEAAGLSFSVDCPPHPEPVYLDREMWEKVVFNLLSNAFKFTFEGGIAVALTREDDKVALRIRDTGTGIPAADLPHLFERFHRVRGARGRSIEGTGIGLAMVQELVRLHGGSIAVESEPGRGSTFTVSLRLGAAHLPPERIRPARGRDSEERRRRAVEALLGWPAEGLGLDLLDRVTAEPATERARILLAEDNPDMRGYLRRMLSESYTVDAVGDGRAALRAARENRPDLVLTDVMMPELDGFGLLRELRNDERLRTVPVIMLSARAGEEARVEGMESGADDYLVKPFSGRELMARVSARIEHTRLRERANEMVRVSESRYRAIFETAGASIWDEDFSAVRAAIEDLRREGVSDFGRYFAEHPEFVQRAIGLVRIVDVNDTTLRMYGASDKAELTGSLHRIFLPETLPIFLEELVAIAEGKPGFEAETVVSTLGGERLDVQFIIAFPPADGDFQPALVTIMDITARKQAERSLRDLYHQRMELIERLRQADRQKDEFLATLAHELRNPLAPLRNSLHLLRLGDGGTGTAAPIHAMMERQVSHMVRLVDDLLEISRITRGTFELRREPVELATVVRNAIETSDPLIQAAGHQLEVVLPEEPLVVDGDPVRLAQVLSNLLNNSAKYTAPGGTISIRARREPGAAVVAVRDSGRGISPEVLPRLFEMFSRGAGSGEPDEGLGIGLALARRLVEMHGGSIEGESGGPGRGSEFTIRLPLSQAEESRQTPTAPVVDAMFRKRILVVDDNRDSAESMSMLLGVLGAEVRVALDGPTALAIYEEFDPTVVLLDIGMPDMDGYEVARRIRAGFPERATAIVALTGWGQDQDRWRTRTAGFDHHLTKPADIAGLQALLHEVGS